MIHAFSLSNNKTNINIIEAMNTDVPGSPKTQSELRKRIREIHQDDTLEPQEKARRVQKIMSSQCSSNKLDSVSAYSRTYHDKGKGILGCKHYQRKVKLQADCCQQLFSCHFCHDEASDHTIVRQQTKNMLCMQCLTLQPTAQFCSHCGIKASHYYCDKCKMWDDDESKSIYHCDACGICRKGRGLNDDFFHCDKCNVCMTITMKDNHRCIERSLESDCPVCGEYMFTSTITVNFMPCGHSIHRPCLLAYSQTSYQCPICLKSFKDMTQYFKQLDDDLQRQSMPSEYKDRVSLILCNDCENRSEAPYHFFYHKCQHCASYNTTLLSVKASTQQQ